MSATLDASLIGPPPLGLALTELHRTVGEFAGLKLSERWLNTMSPGDGHGVMLLPGFLGDDGYNGPLRKYLQDLNYTACGWGMGRNLGPRGDVLERLIARMEEMVAETGGKISLIGHSLGGIYARELAKKAPHLVRQVVSLGSPFGEGRDTGSYPRRFFSLLNPDEEISIDQYTLVEPPPVPTTAVYSKGDGIVNWRTAVQAGSHEHVQNIRVWGSHCGLTLNPSVWFLLAERLGQPENGWQPFQRKQWRSLFYPKSDST